MRITTLAMLTSLGLTGALGCATEQEQAPLPPVSELQQGINILQADPAVGVMGAYRQNDDVVYFETRVGYLKPEIYREAFPDEPAEEMDMRFVDRNGLTFYAQRGGDQFVDPTWNDSIADSFDTYVTDEARARDFEMAQTAGLEFAQVADPSLASHTFEMRAYGERLLPSEDPKLIARAAEIESVPRPEVADASWSGSGMWWLEGDMYTKSVAWFGSHAGVAMWAYDTSWKLQILGYNHADWSSMSYKCYSSSNAWVSNPYWNAETATGTGTVSGGCSTGYDWDAYGGEHNSNDDAAYELWQTKEGKTNTSHGDARTFQWQASNKHYACGINCGGNCGGRWTAPANCP